MYNDFNCENMTNRDDIELISEHKADRVNCWKPLPCEQPYKQRMLRCNCFDQALLTWRDKTCPACT